MNLQFSDEVCIILLYKLMHHQRNNKSAFWSISLMMPKWGDSYDRETKKKLFR